MKPRLESPLPFWFTALVLAALIGLNLPVAPVGLRYRAAYQNAVRLGKSVEEAEPGSLAAQEVGALWRLVQDGLWPSLADHDDEVQALVS